MPVTIEIHGERATITDREWTSPRPSLTRLLTSFAPPFGVSPAIPGVDLYLAQLVIDALGGTMIDEGEPPPFDPTVVY